MSSFKKAPVTAEINLQIIAKDEHSSFFLGFDWQDNNYALLFDVSIYKDDDKRGSGSIFITPEMTKYYQEKAKGILAFGSNPLAKVAKQIIELTQGYYVKVSISDPQKYLDMFWLQVLMNDMISFMRDEMSLD